MRQEDGLHRAENSLCSQNRRSNGFDVLLTAHLLQTAGTRFCAPAGFARTGQGGHRGAFVPVVNQAAFVAILPERGDQKCPLSAVSHFAGKASAAVSFGGGPEPPGLFAGSGIWNAAVCWALIFDVRRTGGPTPAGSFLWFSGMPSDLVPESED